MEIIINEDGKYEVDVPVAYAVYGTVPLVFDTLEDMTIKLNNREFISDMPLPDDPSYTEDSYCVDYEVLQEMIEKFQEKA